MNCHLEVVKRELNLKIDLGANQDLVVYLCNIDHLVLKVIFRCLANLDDGDAIKTSDQILFMVSLLRNLDWMSHLNVSCNFHRRKRGLLDAGGEGGTEGLVLHTFMMIYRNFRLSFILFLYLLKLFFFH